MPYKDVERRREGQRKYRDENPDVVKRAKAKYRENNREKLRDKSREYHSRAATKEREYLYFAKYKYGISKEEYALMLQTQNGVCFICGETNNGRRLHIDHDHDTGKVRSLLCQKCNMILGLCGESVNKLDAIAKYIKEYR